jgi:hypothetical protein
MFDVAKKSLDYIQIYRRLIWTQTECWSYP